MLGFRKRLTAPCEPYPVKISSLLQKELWRQAARRLLGLLSGDYYKATKEATCRSMNLYWLAKRLW